MRLRACMRVLCSHGVLVDLSDGDESLGNEGTPFIRPGTGSDDEPTVGRCMMTWSPPKTGCDINGSCMWLRHTNVVVQRARTAIRVVVSVLGASDHHSV